MTNHRVFDALDLSEDIDQVGKTRVIALGFTYLFGVNKNKPQAAFDFGN